MQLDLVLKSKGGLCQKGKDMEGKERKVVNAAKVEKNKCDGCKQKGLCCHRAIRKGGYLYILPSLKCKYLDENNECTIYDNRHEIYPECATMEDLAKFGGVPSKCNYKNDYNFPYNVRIASPDKERILLKRMNKKGRM